MEDEEEDFAGHLLHKAVLWDNSDLLRDLLHGDQKRYINAIDSKGRTALHAAVATESVACVEILLDSGADPNAGHLEKSANDNKRNALHMASDGGHVKLVELLIKHSANILAKDVNGLTSMDIAEQAGHSEVVEILKRAADQLESKKQHLYDDLWATCSKGNVLEAEKILKGLGKDAEVVVNTSTNGSNTLLFKACEEGHEAIVRLLIEYEADGRVHPVTKYSPLYIACYYGRKNIVNILLEKFPELINVPTVERWLPLHAAAINNHADIVEQLLAFEYPERVLHTFVDKSAVYEYRMAFDLNAQDVTCQTALYVAAFLGNQRLVEVLVNFRVPAVKIETPKDKDETRSDRPDSIKICDNSKASSSPRKFKSNSIQTIISKLSSSGSNKEEESQNAASRETRISPLDFDLYCNNDTETPFHVAVKKKYYPIASCLLQNGANPNIPILPSNFDDNDSQDDSRSGSSALREACKNRDASLVDLLIRYGARDDDCQALFVASRNRDNHLMSKLLALKAHPDPEFKINRKAIELPGFLGSGIMGPSSVTFSSMFPTTPVMINWHSLQCLSSLRRQWLIDASVAHNIKLKLNIQNQCSALMGVTRLDLSNNGLTTVPLFIFQLPSLRILNLAQNKLESLPEIDYEAQSQSNQCVGNKMKKSKSFSASPSSSANSCVGWTLPCLEELHLQDNRLESVPACLFDLPSLQLLDLSNNKLRALPFRMWFSPKLRELNLSLNLLRDLPSKLMPGSGLLSGSPLHRLVSASLDSQTSAEKAKSRSLSKQSSVNSEEDVDDEATSEGALNLKLQPLRHFNLWAADVNVASVGYLEEEHEKSLHCKLSSLNLSHNGFTTIPGILSCIALNLTRLNLSYNCLTSIGCLKLFPNNLKHLDMSYNQLTSWAKLEIDDKDREGQCYCASQSPETNPKGSPSLKSKLKSSYCIHKQHNRLDNLRSLVLSNNQLTSIKLMADCFEASDEFEQLVSNESKHLRHSSSRLLFPNLSMLDVGNNHITEIPTNIAELYNLSVLHLNHNVNISRLPPEMGLLSKLWNLGLRGCSLLEPLKGMVESKKYKTMDIIGYLKSILEDSKPYARMKLMVVGVQGIGKTSLLEQLRQEGTGTFRRKPPEHWAKRMGNKNVNLKTPKGVTLSTVGVDVCDWTYEKRVKGQTSFGPVTFRTWDFGGQKEYYSTHQYFLSKRSLYLVVWKMIDGEKAVHGIQQWLVNIQARAPNAPVIIVGTHYDIIKELYPPFYSQDLQQTIREKFINIVDPDKRGLPRVMDSIEVSAKTKYNIKLLCNLIYEAVFEIRSPGTKERLLEQKIPATYLALEDVVGSVACERRLQAKDPVLRGEEYKSLVMDEMQRRFGIVFRDVAELHQATAFLHENGVLLHYEDATLKDLYFLDPQWLCDILAHVVTIREINPYAKNGIMKSDDLKHLFKSSSCAPSDAKTYIVNLLNKFEVALTWDSRTLLIPSLLPTEQHLQAGLPGCDVRIPVRSRGWAIRSSRAMSSVISTDDSTSISSSNTKRPASLSIDSVKLTISSPLTANEEGEEKPSSPSWNVVDRPHLSVYRLLVMTYFPSGFWSRLMTRMLGDDFIIEIIRSYFTLSKDGATDPLLVSLFSRKAEWMCWQTGIALRHLDTIIFRVKEVLPSVANQPFDYCQPVKFMLQQEENWNDIEIQKASILEIYLPNQSIQVQTLGNPETHTILPNQESVAKLLAVTVDHVDTLLEDWYPSLGTRFVHTSEGRFLVTRFVPCTRCLNKHISNGHQSTAQPNLGTISVNWSRDGHSVNYGVYQEDAEASSTSKSGRNVGSWDSLVSHDSGVGYESTDSSRKPSKEGSDRSEDRNKSMAGFNALSEEPVVYCFLVEECILRASEERSLKCPVHGELQLRGLAPDTVFVDLGDHCLIKSEHIRKGKMLGRGAFGFVFRASVKQRGSNMLTDVAMKMLQPVDPGHGAKQSDTVAYKAASSKWQRDPMQYACKAYCTARQELNILLILRHPHIVPLIGVCTRPLALILRLAPMGALDLIIKDYRRSGVQLNSFAIQKIVLQIAKALEYLHQQHIIYRDLKSENVLVWKITQPYESSRTDHVDVEVKLADYGISRSTLPTGTKGFGGTEGFMAPEIMRYNGEEEYTEKVDCFSFGMFIFELLSLRLPFEGQECVKDHILDGGRPSLSPRDVMYPSYLLDLMTLCWSEVPKDRPAASQIVSIASAPEFVHMLDVISLVENYAVLSAAVLEKKRKHRYEVWLSRLGKQTDILFSNEHCWQDYKTLIGLNTVTVTAMCVVPEDTVWLGDSKAVIHVYSTEGPYKEISNFRIDPEDDTATAVRSLVFIQSLDSLAVSSTSGRLWLCDRIGHSLKEIGNNGVPFLSVTSVDVPDGCCELWCGQTEGRICVITVKGAVITSQEVANHYSDDVTVTPYLERLDVFDIISEYPYVWTYLYPGCFVYQWDITKRLLLHRLDCSKLAPCSESLMSISIEEHLSPGKCQVTAMAVVDDELYIGTTWGCLVIVEGSTMRPITVFRPYEEEVKAILPFQPKSSPNEQQTPVNESSPKSELCSPKTSPKYLVTVGKGFRSLVSRYIYLPKEKLHLSSQKGHFVILWKTGNWVS